MMARVALIVAITIGASARNASVILIVTDDQDLTLGSMHAMPAVRKHIRDRGVEMSNFFANSPICVPSRITLLSGRLIHNMQCASFPGFDAPNDKGQRKAPMAFLQ